MQIWWFGKILSILMKSLAGVTHRFGTVRGDHVHHHNQQQQQDNHHIKANGHANHNRGEVENEPAVNGVGKQLRERANDGDASVIIGRDQTSRALAPTGSKDHCEVVLRNGKALKGE